MSTTSPPLDPAPWYALREYLVQAYANSEMRALAERSLLAEAGARLPDERVPAEEYAATLCGLIQRHWGVPSPDFWRRLADDRPSRQREIAGLRQVFLELERNRSAAASRRASAELGARPRWSPARFIAAAVVSLGVVLASYCASAPGSSRSRDTIQCKDGTRSPTCYEVREGCCSNHGGVLTQKPTAAP